MFCSKCGTQVAESAAFCANCGNSLNAQTPVVEVAATAVETPVVEVATPVVETPVEVATPVAAPVYQEPTYSAPTYQEPTYQAPTYQQAPVYNNAPAVDAKSLLIKGIVAIACACSFYGSIVGIIFGSLAKKEAAQFMAANGGQLFGKAKVGAILGKVGFIVGIVMTVFFGIWLLALMVAGA